MSREIRPRVDTYTVPVRAAAPQAIGLARALGRLFGRGIRGEVGTVRYGAPAIGTQSKYLGYAAPPQLFVGYDPRKVAAGAIRAKSASLPSGSASSSMTTLQASMAAVSAAQMGL